MRGVLAEPAPAAPAFAWSAGEREGFFAAIERHRRAARRVSLACGLGAGVLAVLLAPLIFCVTGIVIDLLNLVTPMPDALGTAGHAVDRITNGKHVALPDIIGATALAALPGLVLMGVVGLVLRRALRASPLFAGGEVPGRPLDRSVLVEQRIANVVEEMAIAAAIPPPRVVVVPGGVNAAAAGLDARHATILIGEALLRVLNRDQLQGVIAHLIGSIAGGDMRIGLRAATTLALFVLMARMTSVMTNRDAWRNTTRLLRTLAWPTAASANRLMEQLGNPMGDDEPAANAAPASAKLTWKEWAEMPLMGPVMFAGLMGAIVSTFLLAPLIALAWRQRKYMADAAAVQLDRNPDALAAALATIARRGDAQALPAWAAHLAVVGTGAGGGSLLAASVVPVIPSIAAREKALVKLGASVHPVAGGGLASLPTGLRVAIAVLVGILAILGGVAVYLLTMLSVAMSALFLVFPTALLHVFLRWLAH